MRTKLLTALFMAGTVVGCASNPPPPPPMADMTPAPAPAPMPMATGPMAGAYMGTPELASDAPASCAKMTRSTTVRVMRNNTFTMMGMRGMIGPDGTITSRASRGMSMTGMASPTGLDVTTMRGKCSYHVMLTKG